MGYNTNCINNLYCQYKIKFKRSQTKKIDTFFLKIKQITSVFNYWLYIDKIFLISFTNIEVYFRNSIRGDYVTLNDKNKYNKIKNDEQKNLS